MAWLLLMIFCAASFLGCYHCLFNGQIIFVFFLLLTYETDAECVRRLEDTE